MSASLRAAWALDFAGLPGTGKSTPRPYAFAELLMRELPWSGVWR